MKIAKLEIYKYSLPLNVPLYVRREKLNQREGLLIAIHGDQGHVGFGEIAPLPGLSQETFEEALEQIQRFKLHLLNQTIPHHVERLNGKFDAWLGSFNLHSSVRCGIEMCVLNLIADAKGIGLHHLLFSTSYDRVRINGLVQGSQSEVEQEVSRLINDGFTAIKLKVGGEISDDIQKVKAVNKIIDGRALLHLDANQGWDFDQALEFGNEVGPAAMDYIEEPFKDLSRIPDFFQETLIPVALDESLTHKNFEAIKSIEGVDFLILKPMIFGGIEKAWELMTEAKKFAFETVISSSFESSVGISTLAHLAATSSHHNMAGLDTLKYFKKNLFNEDLRIDKGKMDLTALRVNAQDINFDLLQKIL